MQEINTEVLQFSNYFTYVTVSNPMYGQEISASRFVELYLGLVVSEIIILLHAHTRTHTHTHTHTPTRHTFSHLY
jgi:hypothetical protein